MYIKAFNKCKQFKKKNTSYELLPPKIITELKPWELVHINRIGLYVMSIGKHQPDEAIIYNYFSLACMKIIYTSIGGLKMVKATSFELK